MASEDSSSSTNYMGCISASVTILVALIGLATALVQSGLLKSLTEQSPTVATATNTTVTPPAEPPSVIVPPSNPPPVYVTFKSLVVPLGARMLNINGAVLTLRNARYFLPGDATSPARLCFAFQVDNKSGTTYPVDDSIYRLHVFPSGQYLTPQISINNMVYPGQKETYDVIFSVPAQATGATLSMDLTVPGRPKPLLFGFKF